MSKINLHNHVTIKGVLSIALDGKITMSVEDVGDVELDRLLKSYDGCDVTLSVSRDYDFPMVQDN